jgi:hypothetical protein
LFRISSDVSQIKSPTGGGLPIVLVAAFLSSFTHAIVRGSDRLMHLVALIDPVGFEEAEPKLRVIARDCHFWNLTVIVVT